MSTDPSLASVSSRPPGESRASPPRILILGAGPTGLGAAYRLKELGHSNFLVVDRHPYLGGLSASFTDASGFTWDIGGHVLFSHYPYYDKVFAKLIGSDYTNNSRESWIRLKDRWVPYPFQNNVRHLPPEVAYECILGLIKAQTASGGVRAAIDAAQNFAEFNHAVFGEGLCRYFMTPYNFKVWAHPAEMMNKTWIGERVAVIDIERALRNIILQRDDFGWGPNNTFKFPLYGTGSFYQRFGPVLEGHVQLGRRAVWVDVDRKVVGFADGSMERYDHLLSTMPLDRLCAEGFLRGDVPESVRDAAGGLRHSSGHMVGVGLRRDGGSPSTRSWMYFPEDDCPFYRVTYLSNYSPKMTPDPARYYSFLCETSASSFKPVDASRIVEDTIQGLVNTGLLVERDRESIVTTWHYHADYSYPTPTVDRDARLAAAIPWLESRQIASRGRFGMWKYEVANTDHSLMQGVEWVNRVLLGESEKTIGVVYRVTEDGRQQTVHERPSVAGSGEKRLPEIVVADRAAETTAGESR